MVKLTKSFINNLSNKTCNKTYWDDILKGFGLRIQGKSRSWIIVYRDKYNKQHWFTLGSLNKITPDEARKLASKTFLEISNGNDPATNKQKQKNAITVNELCDSYLEEECSDKKDSTLYMIKSRINCHIKPLIGNLPVSALDYSILNRLKADIAMGKHRKTEKSGKLRGLRKIKGGKSVANKTLTMLHTILEYAIKKKIIKDNPVKTISRYKEQSQEIFLDLQEMEQLGKALQKAEEQNINQIALNAIKFLSLTGLRKNEALTLRWEYIDFDRQIINFPDTKSGPQIRPIGKSAIKYLLSLKSDNKSPWVFPSANGKTPIVCVPTVLIKICSLKDNNGNLFINKKLSLHKLRHSFATIANNLGYSIITIGGLLGHKSKSKIITERYIHTVDSALIGAADETSLHISQALKLE